MINARVTLGRVYPVLAQAEAEVAGRQVKALGADRLWTPCSAAQVEALQATSTPSSIRNRVCI